MFIDSAEVEYRSPNLDGIQDDLELPIRITDGGLVEGYVLVIEDEAGNVVRMIRNKEWQAESAGVPDAFERLFTVKSGIEVPQSLVWDGRSSGGNVVTDGSYRYYLEAWDDRGNHAQTTRRTVVVDNTPPRAAAQAVELLFSPNGDGNKDTLTIEQQLSSEERWQAQLLDASDAPVASFEWEGEAPTTVEWDGRRDDGTMATDGIYGYHVFSTDRAGNFRGGAGKRYRHQYAEHSHLGAYHRRRHFSERRRRGRQHRLPVGGPGAGRRRTLGTGPFGTPPAKWCGAIRVARASRASSPSMVATMPAAACRKASIAHVWTWCTKMAIGRSPSLPNWSST